jgi:hypothetical protein
LTISSIYNIIKSSNQKGELKMKYYIPNWWFNPPTQNQVNFASDIAKRLVYTLPKEYTKKAYSDFISAHINEYQMLKY